MSEEELYELLNIPNKPWIELTDEEKHLFEKNDIYIENLHQQLKDKDEKISKTIEYIKENVKAELLNGSIWIDKYKLIEILESE